MDSREVATLESGNGTGGDNQEEETQDQLKTAFKTLGQLTRPDGSLVSMTKQDLSLLKQMLVVSSEEYRKQMMWRMCDFCDEEEALTHVSAYFEAIDLGMDTDLNVANMFSLVSANRRGIKNNLMAQLLDTLQHGKWAPTAQKGKQNGSVNPRSPLSY